MKWYKIIAGFVFFLFCAELSRQGFILLNIQEANEIFGVFLISIALQMSYFINEWLYPEEWEHLDSDFEKEKELNKNNPSIT